MNPSNANQSRRHQHQPVVTTSGGMHFSGGEVWDDYKETLQCQTCGRTLKASRKPIKQDPNAPLEF
jgi:hypothetical protein